VCPGDDQGGRIRCRGDVADHGGGADGPLEIAGVITRSGLGKGGWLGGSRWSSGGNQHDRHGYDEAHTEC